MSMRAGCAGGEGEVWRQKREVGGFEGAVRPPGWSSETGLKKEVNAATGAGVQGQGGQAATDLGQTTQSSWSWSGLGWLVVLCGGHEAGKVRVVTLTFSLYLIWDNSSLDF